MLVRKFGNVGRAFILVAGGAFSFTLTALFSGLAWTFLGRGAAVDNFGFAPTPFTALYGMVLLVAFLLAAVFFGIVGIGCWAYAVVPPLPSRPE